MTDEREWYSEMLHAAASPDAAEPFLRAFGERLRPAEAQEGALDWVLESMLGHPLLCAKALLTWLNNAAGEQAAEALMHLLSVEHLQARSIPALAFPGTTPSEALVVARKMSARCVTPSYALGWIMAILRIWPANAEAEEGANELMDYLSEEFPFTVQQLLSTAPVDSLGQVAREMVARYQQMLDSEREWLEGLPFLEEFAMSRDERDVVRSLRRAFQRDVMRGAESGSVLMQFVTRKRFKYAQIVSFGGPSPNRPSESMLRMESVSVSTELPHSEWRDPMHGLMTRHVLWKRSGS